MGIIKGILKEIRSFVIDMFRQWAGYILPATGAVAAIELAPYLGNADSRQYTFYFIYAYSASVFVIRLAYRNNRWSLLYARQFLRFMYWFIAVSAAIFAPLIPGFFPFITLPGILSKLGISLIVLILMLLLGGVLRIGELFKYEEDEMVRRFQNRYATPDYEAILRGEEFDYRSKPPLTRRERLTKWWEWQKTLLRRYVRKLKDA